MTNRIHFLDNLRTTIIFFVILYHAGGVYESSGIWSSFWIVDDSSTNNVTGIILLILDIFMVPTLFFISGYLTPKSTDNKKWKEFIVAKAKRLLLPWFMAVFSLIPIYRILFLYSRNLPQESWSIYFHIYSPNSQNWLWFLPVLFMFNIIYLMISKTKFLMPKMSLKSIILGVFLVGFAYSLVMDLLGFRGWILTPLLDFQKERILIYFLFFLLGVQCFRLKVFDEKPKSKKFYIIINSISWIPINTYIFFLLFPFIFSPGNYIFSRVIDRSIVWLSFQLSLLCILYILIETYWRYFDSIGKLWNELNQNSYYVYITHVIIIGVVALLLFNISIPSFLKHITLAVITFLVSNFIISFYRKTKN